MIAYISYDSLTGDMLSIAWNRPIDSFIEVDTDIAEGFMIGKMKMHEYFVHLTQKVLKKKEIKQRISKSFWSLKLSDTNIDGMKVLPIGNEVKIVLNGASSNNLMLFATIKNDPSWLIQSWDLADYDEVDETISINFLDSEKYSYYIGKMR